MVHAMRSYWLAAVLGLLVVGIGDAQVAIWKLGDSGLKWSEQDSVRVFIDAETTPGAIQPLYLTDDQNLLSQIPDWISLRFPRELGYVDGLKPRIWLAAGSVSFAHLSGTPVSVWVDGDSTTYFPASSLRPEWDWYTIDLGVPVPADRFGFFTPPRGFTADGRLLVEDAYEAYEVSIAEETDPVLAQEQDNNDYHPLESVVARVPNNFRPVVDIDFPRQYVRYVRFKRLLSERSRGTGVRFGTIGDFELFAEGVPKRVVYLTRIIDLGREVNFGRLSWAATPMRVVDGERVEVINAQASIEVEMRSGRDEDPNIYYEFTDSGDELIVSRERYEHELKPSLSGFYISKPGVRASIRYDRENWSFWSFPITESDLPAPLPRGRYLQLKVTLESASFADFLRLDSLWLEFSPLLARQVVGEAARLHDPQPMRGFTEVELGELTEFSYDIKADFNLSTQRGFDAVRVRTGNRALFKHLQTGDPLTTIEPVRVVEEEEELTVHLPQKIVSERNLPVRVVFETGVFMLANTFEGEVFDTSSDDLPQHIEAGDATNAVGTNSLRIWGTSGQAEPILKDLRFSTPVVTPNGDKINDRLKITYTLFRLPAPIPIKLNVYRLDGTPVVQDETGLQGAGPQQAIWDGRDSAGQPLPPGLYLVELHLESEFKTVRHVQPVGIAY